MTGPFQDPVYVVALHVLEALSLLELYFKDPRYVELVTHLGPYLEMYAITFDCGCSVCTEPRFNDILNRGEIDAKSIALSILLPQTTFTEGREALAKSGLLLQASALVKESPSEEIQGKALDVLKYWTMSLSDDSLAPQEKPFVVATQNLDQDLGVIENLSEAFRTAQSAFKFDVAQAAIAWMSEVRFFIFPNSSHFLTHFFLGKTDESNRH